MPLSCLNGSGQRLQAFDLNADQWVALKAQNRQSCHLRMPCCDAGVVLKQSKRGTQFFAHKKVGPCLTADEGEEHRQLKMLAVEAARSCGWHAATEVAGISPSGKSWRADVLATKGNARVAIEIQWSGQVDDETLRRQQRYRNSGVRGLWLLRQTGFPVVEELPAVCIGGTIVDGFHALLPYQWRRMTRNDRLSQQGWKAVLPMHEFLSAAFTQRLKWGRITEIGADAEAEVLVAEADCEKCGVITDIIVGVELQVAGARVDVSLLDLTPYNSLIREVRDHLPPSFDQSHLKVRYSRSRNERYLSNGCSGCDRLYGDFHLAGYRNEAKVACRFPISLTGDWLQLVQASDDWEDSEPEWWLLPPVI